MTGLDNARRAAREFLKLMCGDAAPEWRTCYLDGPAAEPTGLAPVCPDESHEATDGNAYACCPEPVVECESYKVAEYLVALLNADREGGAA
ncbi:hypothetical protein [Streptomyces sp. NRRL F-5630]|uniref:hypothetical protein n=1 Tax=Streptomyces sp. NRRL F-5630 TaxID=1463864 RepID=UPI003D748D81